MGDTFIPGEDLQQVVQLLPHIKQLLSSANDATLKYNGFLGIGGDDAFGDSELTMAVSAFQLNWSDGDYQLGKEIDNLTKMANNILTGFQQTDQDLVDELEGKTPPDQSAGGSPDDAAPTLALPPGTTRYTPGSHITNPG